MRVLASYCVILGKVPSSCASLSVPVFETETLIRETRPDGAAVGVNAKCSCLAMTHHSDFLNSTCRRRSINVSCFIMM